MGQPGSNPQFYCALKSGRHVLKVRLEADRSHKLIGAHQHTLAHHENNDQRRSGVGRLRR